MTRHPLGSGALRELTLTTNGSQLKNMPPIRRCGCETD
jgi:hypothetical protein